jgi:hypothetical protein
MDDAYYTAAPGSAEHYAAYEKEFTATEGAGFAFPDDPHASYEVDNAHELAHERWLDEMATETDARYQAAEADAQGVPTDQVDWRDRARRAIQAGLGEFGYEPEIDYGRVSAEWETPAGVEPGSEAEGDLYLARLDAEREKQLQLDRAAEQRLLIEDPKAYRLALDAGRELDAGADLEAEPW